MSDFKNPFGLINGKLTHVKYITKHEEIYCPECHDRLIVREGDVTRKHLAHKINTNNLCANESIVHKYTKMYIYENLKIFKIFNDKIVIENGKFKLSEHKLVHIKNIEAEYRGLNSEYIPDLFLELDDNSKIAIEICYKNPKNSGHLEEILWNSPISQVYEINVLEKDLIDFNLEDIINRAVLIYNKIGREFEAARTKIINVYNKNNQLEDYTNKLRKEIWNLKGKVDGKYIKKVKYNLNNEIHSLKSQINMLIEPNLDLDILITSWRAKVFNEKQRRPVGDLLLMESDLQEIRKYYYDLEQEIRKIKDMPDSLKELLIDKTF
ncbi:competence protein CoiA family protein [Clostridioides difficile]|uniref:competence protein CoiA family protein n=1 Tax=Clostridioides sp. ZZV15-6598 TaxID=2811501 RepID=UPI001D12DD5C|nr:hypothetical protein [Clostridioides sp. ZZV15-6598]